MLGLKVIDDEMRGQFCLLAVRYLIRPSLELILNERVGDVVLKHFAEISGQLISQELLVRHHLLVLRLLLRFLLLLEEAGADLLQFLPTVALLHLVEHERMLDVALLDVLGQEVEVVLLGLVDVAFFFVVAPERVLLVAHLGQAHDLEEIGHKGLPYFVDLLHLPLDKGDQLIGRLLDPSLQVSKAVVDHLVDDLPALGVDTHAAEWVLGVEANGQVLADGVDLVAGEGEHLVVLEQVRLVADVLQAEVYLHPDDDGQLLKLRRQLYCEVQQDAALMRVVFLADLVGEAAVLEAPLQGRTERKLIETVQSSGCVS